LALISNRPTSSTAGVASRLEAAAAPALGGELPIRVRAWDGSVAGPADAPTVHVRTPDALRRLVYRPGELGLAQAYVTGEIDVEGDLLDGFRRVRATVRRRETSPRLTAPAVLDALRALGPFGMWGLPPAPPASQTRLRGRLSPLDLSHEFSALMLDPHMAYSCAYFTRDDPGYTLEDAQRDKLDLVCRKLGLHLADEGHRHLDIGCGWGSLTLFAAEEYGVHVVGVTISAEQKAFIDERLVERGLQHRVEIRLQDYREVTDEPFDTISSIEMGEHVGERNYPVYAGRVHTLLREGGGALVQQMSRDPSQGGGPFVEAFIAPDMHMRPVDRTVEHFERAGLEVRDVHGMREHYVRTVDAWYAAFEDNWEPAVAMVGEEVARAWRLYLAGGALSFEEGRMGVDQILMVRHGR
jgi:cyclopropane-fatty-acyl-phospholipid synthase